jgi:hypothetical protein
MFSDRAGDLLFPDGPGVPVGLEPLVLEVGSEEPELPELVGDVLGRVGDGPVGADEDLVRLLEALEAFRLRQLEDPAPGVAPFGLVGDGAGLLQPLEGALPELPPEDCRSSYSEPFSERRGPGGGAGRYKPKRWDSPAGL